jgi:hypothetical protein
VAPSPRDPLVSLLAGVVGGILGGFVVVALIAVLWAWVFQPIVDASLAEPAVLDSRDV